MPLNWIRQILQPHYAAFFVCIHTNTRPHTCFLCSTFCAATTTTATSADECLQFPIRQQSHGSKSGEMLAHWQIQTKLLLYVRQPLSIRAPHRHILSLLFNPNAIHAESANKTLSNCFIVVLMLFFSFLLYSTSFRFVRVVSLMLVRLCMRRGSLCAVCVFVCRMWVLLCRLRSGNCSCRFVGWAYVWQPKYSMYTNDYYGMVNSLVATMKENVTDGC